MDRIFDAFCQTAQREAEALAAQSDVLTVTALPPWPPSRYVLRFQLPYLRRTPQGTFAIGTGPVMAGIHFPADYLLGTSPGLWFRVVRIATADFAHPNVRNGVVCLGSQFQPGTPFRALARMLYDLLTYQLMTLDERNALDPEVCQVIRSTPELIARLSVPPLTRRTHRLLLKEGVSL